MSNKTTQKQDTISHDLKENNESQVQSSRQGVAASS